MEKSMSKYVLRCLSLLMALVLALGLSPAAVYAADAPEEAVTEEVEATEADTAPQEEPAAPEESEAPQAEAAAGEDPQFNGFSYATEYRWGNYQTNYMPATPRSAGRAATQKSSV